MSVKSHYLKISAAINFHFQFNFRLTKSYIWRVLNLLRLCNFRLANQIQELRLIWPVVNCDRHLFRVNPEEQPQIEYTTRICKVQIEHHGI
jgi:hypothetical protein